MSAWYLQGRNGQVLGPLSEEHIVRGLRAGKVPLDTMASPTGQGDWQSLMALPLFAPVVHEILTEREQGTSLTIEPVSPSAVTSPGLTRKRISPWPLVAMGVLSLALAVVMGRAMRNMPARTAEGQSAQLLGYLERGDVGALRVHRELGLSTRMAAEVQQRGTAELERRQKLLERAFEAGDKQLHDLAKKVKKAGEESFRQLSSDDQQQVLTGGDRAAWLSLSGEERQRNATRAYTHYVNEHGFTVLSEAERAQLSSPAVFLGDEALVTRARRQLGLPTLTPTERTEVEELPPAGDSARQRFVDAQGTASLSGALRSDLLAGGYRVDSTQYRGTSSHAVLRGTTAVTTMAFDEEHEVPARRWLPEQLFWRYTQGTFRADREHETSAAETRAWLKRLLEPSSAAEAPAASPAPELDPLASQALATSLRQMLRGPASSLLGSDLLSVLLVVLVSWLVLGRAALASGSELRAGLSRDIPRVVGGVLALAALQHITEGQVNLDDWIFLPLYLTLPCLAGALRGPRPGYVLGLVAGGVLLLVAALSHPAAGSAGVLDLLPLGDFVLATVSLGLFGALAGALSRRPVLVAFVPLGWLLTTGLLQRDLLASPSPYGHVALGMFWTAFSLTGVLVLSPRPARA